ncbi:LamB/YcsF family protein [Salinisphaera sp. SWV1]|uniref:LamB/YcsF family protein n=1 Tax=Salinisphaera sp. SWV1 TaxID=3454139 RepID=UPI003F857BCA
MTAIDINSDVGESFGRWHLGDDAAIFESVSSANVACGFHAGDPSTLAQTCRDAVAAGVTIGAHVSYRDLAGFGRRFLDCTASELADDILYQIGALDAFARAAGARVRYVKPHGALYNAVVAHEAHAQAVVDAIQAYDDSLPVLGLPGAVVLKKAESQGLRGIVEAFADRAYNADGTLVSRREKDAVLEDNDTITANMIRLAKAGVLIARDGTEIHVDAASICVHGDNPHAVATAAAVRRALEDAGIEIRSFV